MKRKSFLKTIAMLFVLCTEMVLVLACPKIDYSILISKFISLKVIDRVTIIMAEIAIVSTLLAASHIVSKFKLTNRGQNRR